MQSALQGRRLSGIWLLLSIASAILVSGCGIFSQPNGIKLEVPFRQQPTTPWDYCGPANVLMWRLYKGSSEVSLDTIYNWMGGSGSGTSPEKIRDALISWAYVNRANIDRVSCDGGPFDERDIIAARQITSIENSQPVVVIVDSGFHAVLIDGGDWHHDTSTGLYVWDFAYIHDPQASFPDIHYVAGHWIEWYTSGQTCEQIFDEGAVGNTGYNLSTYGDQVVAYGYDGPRPGGDPIPK